MCKWLAIVAVYCLSVATASATILTFQGVGGSWTDITNYGSNMSAACVGSGQAGCVDKGNGFTPDILVSFQTDGNAADQNVAYMQLWADTSAGDSYGDLPLAAFGANAGQMYITLTPTNGALLVLNSFDMAGETGDRYNQVVVVEDGAGDVLFNATGTVSGVPTHSTYTPDITTAGPLRLFLGDSWAVGVDNINFDEIPAAGSSVPEPASLILVGAGLVALVGCRRTVPFRAD
jgi:hypothetical protein